MSTHNISVNVNGEDHDREVEARELLVHFLREDLSLTGTHIGCDTTSCGACTVIWNGRAVKSCTVFAVQANGGSVETIEGVAEGGELHPLQEGFIPRRLSKCMPPTRLAKLWLSCERNSVLGSRTGKKTLSMPSPSRRIERNCTFLG